MTQENRKLFPAYSYDIALDDGAGAGMVAWISGLMVFFAALALAVNFSLNLLTQHWISGLSGSLTVELRPPASAGDVGDILSLSQRHPAVQGGRLLEREEVAALVEPWFGRALPADMPLPALIEFTLAPGADVARLERDIRALSPEAIVDTHASMLGDMQRLAGAARLFVLLLTGVIVALAVVTVAGIVRAKLSIHAREVETLHLIGAGDEYIARQFRRHTLRGTLKGALAGLCGMAAVLLAVGAATHTVDTAVFPHLRLAPLHWAALLTAPLLAGLMIAHLTAQRAVMAELKKLP